MHNSDLITSKNLLKKGKLVIFPTETVFGLGGNATSSKALKAIYKLKKRPKNNPLIVHYSDLKMLRQDCEINDLFLKL